MNTKGEVFMSVAVSREKLAAGIGVSPDTIRGWQDRYFKRGVHYTVIGKTTLYYLSDIERWLDSQKKRGNEDGVTKT